MNKRTLIGAHASAAGGVHQALLVGQQIGATTIQLFTSNQKQWRGRKITAEEIALWKQALETTGIEEVMSHASYLINLGSSNSELLHKSRAALVEELERCHALEIPYLNFHPGSATGGSIEQCLETIVESLCGCEKFAASGKTRLILETTAGQGTSVGHRFEHIAFLLEGAKSTVPLGVCIDTCHVFAAGYDIRTENAFQQMLQEFDEIIGLEHLCALHLNDSGKELGARVDRHAPIGKGKIGLDAFRLPMIHPKMCALPKYLETPDGPPLWKEEIALLKEFAQDR